MIVKSLNKGKARLICFVWKMNEQVKNEHWSFCTPLVRGLRLDKKLHDSLYPVSKNVFEVINNNYMHVMYVLLIYPKFTARTRGRCGSSVFIIGFEHIQKNTQPAYLSWILMRPLNNFICWSLSTSIFVIF